MKFRNKEVKIKLFTYIPKETKQKFVIGIIVFLLLFSFIPKPLYLFEGFTIEQSQKFAYLFDVFVLIAFYIVFQVGYTIAHFKQERKYNQKIIK